MSKTACVIAALFFIPAADVSAVPVRLTFEGKVTDLGRADAFFSVGDSMTGTLIYESSVPFRPDFLEPDRQKGQFVYYPFIYPNHGFVTIGTYTVQLTDITSHALSDAILVVGNDMHFNVTTIGDQFSVGPHAVGADLGDLRPSNFYFALTDWTASAFDRRDIPTSLPALSRFDLAQWTLDFRSPNPNANIYTGLVDGIITAYSTAIVPETSNWVSCILAFCAFFGRLPHRPSLLKHYH